MKQDFLQNDAREKVRGASRLRDQAVEPAVDFEGSEEPAKASIPDEDAVKVDGPEPVMQQAEPQARPGEVAQEAAQAPAELPMLDCSHLFVVCRMNTRIFEGCTTTCNSCLRVLQPGCSGQLLPACVSCNRKRRDTQSEDAIDPSPFLSPQWRKAVSYWEGPTPARERASTTAPRLS